MVLVACLLLAPSPVPLLCPHVAGELCRLRRSGGVVLLPLSVQNRQAGLLPIFGGKLQRGLPSACVVGGYGLAVPAFRRPCHPLPYQTTAPLPLDECQLPVMLYCPWGLSWPYTT